MGLHDGARFGAAWALAFALVACGSSSSNSGGTSGGSAAGAVSSAGSASSGAGANTGGSGGVAASGGASSIAGSENGGASGAGGAQAVTPAQLFLLTVGNQWNYTTTANPGATLTTCHTGTSVGAITSTDTQAGRTAFESMNYCGAVSPVSLNDNGDIDQLVSGAWVTILKAPITDGASWQTSVATYTWHGPLSATVPAGSFSNCWKRTATASLPDVTYCPGVGTVEIDETTYTTVLTSYSLK